MIKKILLTFLFAFVCFLGIDKLSAETQRIYMGYEGFQTEIGDTRNFSTTAKEFTNQITYSDITNEHDRNSNLYVRYAFCSYDSLYTSSIHINSVNTNIKCMNNDRVGTFTFFTGSYNENHLSTFTQGTNGIDTYVYNTSFNLYGTTSGSFTLYGVDVGRSLDSFPTYDSNSDVLNELDSLHDYLEESLYELNGTTNNILYYLKKLYENMTTCRDSYNLWNNSQVSNFNDYIIPNETGFKILKTSYGRISPPYNLSLDVGTYKILGNFSTNRPSGAKGLLAYSINDDGTNTYFSFVNGRSFDVPKKFSKIVFYMQASEENGTYVEVEDFMIVKNDVFPPSYESFGEEICKSKFDEITDATNESNKQLNDVNNKLQEQQDFMNDDDTSGSSSEAQEFFEGFDTDTYGLTSIITAPLELIGNIAGSTCSPLPLEIPFVGGTFNLPCMSSIYKKHFGSFLTIYQTITFGIVSYWVCIRIFALVKDFKNPEHDEIEVMDL